MIDKYRVKCFNQRMKIKLNSIDLAEFNSLSITKETNIQLAEMYQDYISECSTDFDNDNLNDFKGNTLKDKFYNSFIKSMEIDMKDEENRKILHDAVYPGISNLNYDFFKNNGYLENIKIPEIKFKKMTLTTLCYAAYEGFIYDDVKVINNSFYQEITQLGFFTKEYSYPALLEGDTIWMSINPNEISTMTKGINEATGNVLTLGLGLGYFAYMASLKSDVKSVTIIENNEDTIELFTKYILPQFKNKEKIRIIKEDAFKFLSTLKGSEFDYIYSDLWHNPNDGIIDYIKINQYEAKLTKIKFGYWLETGLLCLLRRCLISLIEESIMNLDQSEYLKAENDTDLIINKMYFLLKDYPINNFFDIKKLLNDDSLKQIAREIKL
jgi:hypothetical protein